MEPEPVAEPSPTPASERPVRAAAQKAAQKKAVHRMCSGMVVMEWDPSWELRAEPNASGPLGPPEWNVAFVHIPARARELA